MIGDWEHISVPLEEVVHSDFDLGWVHTGEIVAHDTVICETFDLATEMMESIYDLRATNQI